MQRNVLSHQLVVRVAVAVRVAAREWAAVAILLQLRKLIFFLFQEPEQVRAERLQLMLQNIHLTEKKLLTQHNGEKVSTEAWTLTDPKTLSVTSTRNGQDGTPVKTTMVYDKK